MIGFLSDYKGGVFELPTLLSWNIRHGLGTPCDAFEIRFLYDTSMFQMLSDAVRFSASHNGDTVFSGVVDEFSITADYSGLTATVRGRGLAALLLDNEADAAEYYYASLQFILDNHVYPWGITNVVSGNIPSCAVFTVNSGSSQWKVLEDFVWFSGGIRPRFSKDGTLLLAKAPGAFRSVDVSTAILEQSYTKRRYGVISQALVKNKAAGISSTVDNAPFINQGGSCRRIINVPRHTYFDAMRHTGEYQVARSTENMISCQITLASQFAAFPGDSLSLLNSPAGITGNYLVSESQCWADQSSAGTVITLLDTDL